MKSITISFLLSFIFIASIQSQTAYDFGFERNNSIVVKDSLGNPQSMAWAGGLNAVHFEEMDLNLDGVMDLITFDIHGNRMMTYINDNIPDSSSYTFAPIYANSLPQCWDWVATYDYDYDGKMDIFTYVPGGIRVFRNTSTSTQLQFTQIAYMLNYLAESGFPTNISSSPVDFPALVDIDLDGDMDILTFHVLGVYVTFYRNYSMELYNVPDSLEFKVYDNCWGKFAESELNNSVVLDNYCSFKSSEPKIDTNKTQEKHAGSTLLALNLDGDSLMDLILGDVDYFTINALYNNGSKLSAHIYAQDSTFPSNNTPINIVSFPVLCYLDINNDSIKDLIASTFDETYFHTSSMNSVWMYKNNGANNYPVLDLSNKSFLQDRMLDVGDGSTPTYTDVNGDGLMDLIIGSYGNVDSTLLDTSRVLHVYKSSRLAYYQNIGTASNPAFKLIDSDWLYLSALNKISLKTTFGDLDGDGDMDMLFGCDDGSIIYKKNIAAAGQPMLFDTCQTNYQNIHVEAYSAPQLIDIDGDSLLDLVIGMKTGFISYYRNTGSITTPIFTLITDTMGHVRPRNYWNYYNCYSVPEFYYDENDSLKAMVGSASGFVFYYRDIRQNILGDFGQDSNLTYVDVVDTLYSVMSFTNESSIWQPYANGLRSAPIMYDWDNDGILDLISGTYAGGLNYFKGTTPPLVGIENVSIDRKPVILLYPNPAQSQINIALENTNDFSKMEVNIFDLSGRLVITQENSIKTNTRLNISDLSKGVYIVQIQLSNAGGKKETKTSKLVKL